MDKFETINLICGDMLLLHRDLKIAFSRKDLHLPIGARKMATLLCFAKGSKSFNAALTLYKNHFHEDVAILTRSLANLAINVRYIRSASGEECAERFLMYEAVEKQRVLERWGIPLPEKEKRKVEAAANEAKKKFGYEQEFKGWSGKSIKEMANSFPNGLYQQIYRFLSTFEHSNPISLKSFVREEENGRIIITDEPDPNGAHRNIILPLYTCSAYLTDEFIQEFTPESNAQFVELNARFKETLECDKENNDGPTS